MVKILVWLKHHLSFIWCLIEKVNSLLFRILWGGKLAACSFPKCMTDIEFRILSQSDMEALATFFSEQPESAFHFFKPHGFDVVSLTKKKKDPAFMMIGCYKNNELAGYAFLRFFFNRQAFRGKIVSPKFQGQGLAKQMGVVTTQICQQLNFRLFATISKDNVKSIASSKAVNDIHIIKELPDNYLYVEYLIKK